MLEVTELNVSQTFAAQVLYHEQLVLAVVPISIRMVCLIGELFIGLFSGYLEVTKQALVKLSVGFVAVPILFVVVLFKLREGECK